MAADFFVEAKSSFIPKFPARCVYCLRDNEHESFFADDDVDVPAHFRCRRLAKHKKSFENVSMIVSIGAVVGLWYLLYTNQSPVLDWLGGFVVLAGFALVVILVTPVYILIENKLPTRFEVSSSFETFVTTYSFADFDYAREFARLNDLDLVGAGEEMVATVGDLNESLESYLKAKRDLLSNLSKKSDVVEPFLDLVRAEDREFESIEEIVEFAKSHESTLGHSGEETAEALEYYLGISEDFERDAVESRRVREDIVRLSRDPEKQAS